MKNILKGLTIYLIFCSQAYAQNCESISRFGDLEVCLPESSGLKESYENQYVKSYAESGHHEGNTILGLYLTKGDFNIIGKGGNSQLHEYVKVFASNKSKNISISNSDFENFTASLVGNFKHSVEQSESREYSL